ncbi:MAG: ferrous iron transporter B, partial [Bdellovibrionales bacterium]|nr:ferrous iron transporter B [Bdellovibrionales bacterium]
MSFSKILLVGSPNSGKTSVFNWLTGSSLRSMNYAGATVEVNAGNLLPVYGGSWNGDNRKVLVLDTPGMVGWDYPSPEEYVTKKELHLSSQGDKQQTLVIYVMDATQISRQLLLLMRIAELGLPTLVALTMTDMIAETPVSIPVLSAELALPVVTVDGRLGGGLIELFKMVPDAHVPEFKGAKDLEALHQRAGTIEERALGKKQVALSETHQKLDQLFLASAIGPVIFFGIMAVLFTSVFWLAQPLMDGIDAGFQFLARLISETWGDNFFSQFVGNGIITGVGSVMTFVPQIVFVSAGLMILEDSGYLSRAATVVDKPLRLLGLNGKSFVPLLMAHACAVPAVLASRTISNRKERLLTLFMIPMMTCSARLPVYGLMIGFLLASSPAWVKGILMTFLYLLGFFAGAITTKIVSKYIPSTEESFFMMELPPYRTPQFRQIFSQSLRRLMSYLKNAGPVILVLSLLIWAASSFPNFSEQNKELRLKSSYLAKVGEFMNPVFEPMGQDWRVGVGILSAFAAREVFVSTVAILFQINEDDDGVAQKRLTEVMGSATRRDGSPLFSVASVLS